MKYRHPLAAAIALTIAAVVPAPPTAHADVFHFFGVTVDLFTGAPVVGAEVVATQPGASEPAWTTTTAADGTWSFDAGAALYSLYFDGGADYQSGYRSCGGYIYQDPGSACVVGPGTEISTWMIKGYVSGRVLDAAGGAPVAGALVEATWEDGVTPMSSAVTAPDGTYRIDGITHEELGLMVDGTAVGYGSGWFSCFPGELAPTFGLGCTQGPGPKPDVHVDPAVCAASGVTVDIGAGDTPTEGDDVILGTDGNDVIDGLGGDDLICGGYGDDEIDGGPGLDTVFGEGGADTIAGGLGNDWIYGGTGGDTIHGTGGGDRLFGGPGDDDVRGGNGHDRISGGPGADVLRGQNGADTIWANTATDATSTDADEMYGGGLRDDIFGDAGDDLIYGGNFGDVLSGKGGDDTIHGNRGADTLRGGPHVTGDHCNGGTVNSGAGDTATACETVVNVP